MGNLALRDGIRSLHVRTSYSMLQNWLFMIYISANLPCNSTLQSSKLHTLTPNLDQTHSLPTDLLPSLSPTTKHAYLNHPHNPRFPPLPPRPLSTKPLSPLLHPPRCRNQHQLLPRTPGARIHPAQNLLRVRQRALYRKERHRRFRHVHCSQPDRT